jgi:hypothetical protein
MFIIQGSAVLDKEGWRTIAFGIEAFGAFRLIQQSDLA